MYVQFTSCICWDNVDEIKFWKPWIYRCRGSPSEAFLRKRVLKICSKFTTKVRFRNRSRNRFSSVNLLYIFRKPIPKNISEGLLLLIWIQSNYWRHFAPSLWIFNFNSKEITSHSDLSSQVYVQFFHVI